MSENSVFDKKLLEGLAAKEPVYRIGVDCYDSDNLAYCLGREMGEHFEILLAKTMRGKREFEMEVKNLSKYFNAEIIGELPVVRNDYGLPLPADYVKMNDVAAALKEDEK